MFKALPLGDNSPNIIFSSFTLCTFYSKSIEPAGHYFEEMAKQRFCDTFYEEIIKDEEEDDAIQEEDTAEYEWEKEFKESQINQKNDLFSQKKENYYQILGIEDWFLNAKSEDFRKAYKRLALLYHPDKNKENISWEGVNETSEQRDNSNKSSSEDEKAVNNKEEELEKKRKKEKDNNKKKNNNSDDEDDEEEDEGVKQVWALTEEQKKQKEINEKWLKIKEAYETLLDPEKRKKYDSTIEFDDTIPEDKEKYTEKEYFRTFGPVFLKNSIWSKKKPVPKIGDMNTPIDKVKRFYRFWHNFQSWRDFSVEGEYNLEEAGSRYEKRQMLKENKKMKSNLLKEEMNRLTKLVQLSYKHDPRMIAEEEKERELREAEKKQRWIQKQKEKEEEDLRLKLLKEKQEEEAKRQQEMLLKLKESLTKEIIDLSKELGFILNNDDKFQLTLNGKIEKFKDWLNKVNEIKDNINERKIVFATLCRSYFSMKIKADNEAQTNTEGVTWTKEEINLLQKGVKRYPAGTKGRWDKIREIVKTKENEDIVQMAHYLSTNPSIQIDGDINLTQMLRKEKEKVKGSNAKNTATSAKSIPSRIDNNVTEKADHEQWTSDEQKLWEDALKTFPSTWPAKDRWSNIAKCVGNKTMKQCVERYKYLASLVKKNK